MHRHARRLVLPVLGLWLASIGWSGSRQASAPAVKISLVPARVSVKVLIDAGAAAAGITAAYRLDLPSVLVIDLGRIAPPAKPAVPSGETGLFRDVRVETDPSGSSVLVLALAEALPFSLTAENGRAVVDLVRILRSGGDAVPPEVQKQLAGAPRPTATLGDVAVAERGAWLDVSARLGRKPLTNIFALDQPLRLVVDLYDTVFARPTLTRAVGKAGVNLVRIGQFKEAPPYSITRFVFELSKAGLFRIDAGGRDWTIAFAPDAAAPTAGEKPAPDAVAPEKTVPAAQLKAGGEEAAPPPLEKPAEKPTEKPPEKTVEKAAESPAPAVQPVLAEPPAEQEKTKARTIAGSQQTYTGEPFSPRFKDADLRDVIMYLGERYGLNVIFDPDVRGTVSGSWTDVPWDQFLDMILKINKMGKSLEGNVLRIMPLNVLAEEERALQQIRDAREASGPLVTKTYELSYAKASDILNLMKNRKSARGDIVIDDRTNTVIATDVAEKIEVLDKLIAALDTATPQVQIETRIIEATSTFVRNLGIQWGWKGMADPFYGNQTSLEFPNKIAADGAMIPQGTTTRGIGGPLGGYAVNLPAPAFNTAVGVSFANVLDSFRLDLALSAMESEGTGRIVSTQRATTLNNKEAYINQGRQIPVQTQANFTVTTQFFNAGLELRATPQITAEGTIIMTIDIQNNAADFANLVNGIPPITTQSAKTTVLVPDGGTTVIGGIYRSEDSITNERVPFLHQIPLLGNLFKNLSKTRTNRELLIFITPRIIQ
jgi:type IV pilus secretin PilQ/predicted competence protein